MIRSLLSHGNLHFLTLHSTLKKKKYLTTQVKIYAQNMKWEKTSRNKFVFLLSVKRNKSEIEKIHAC